MKVDKVMKEAKTIEKQMDALIAFRIKVDKPDGWVDVPEEIAQLAIDVEPASPTVVLASNPSWARSKRESAIEVIKEEGQSDGSSSDENVQTRPNKNNQEERSSQNSQELVFPSSQEILDRVTMNVTCETPLSAIRALLNVPKQTELKFNKVNLQKSEEQLKQAFTALYHKLCLLKSYSYMNMLAFSKIMKKYDKVASRNASKCYMKMVDNSFLGSSAEVNRLAIRVEDTFIKQFTHSNRRKGMKSLRPKSRRERHRITFSFGFFAGCAVALVLALILIIRARNILHNEGGSQYMSTMFPLYILFAFVVLHMTVYASNIFFWRKYRVNYSFIFGFKQGTELGYRDVLYLGFGLAVLTLACVLSNLDMEMDPKTHDYKAYTELLPLMLVVATIGIFLCPFNVLYRSSRFFLIKCAFHCILAPLYTVSLADCILADQLTSQVQAFRSFEFYVCYYGWGDYKHRKNTCQTHDAYSTFYFIVAAVPFTIRLLQCLRRFVEEKDALQGYNGLKYFVTVLAVCTRTAYNLNEGVSWNIIAWVFSAVAAIVCTYWDIVIDWGLLQRHSSNQWLRDKLLIPHKSVYYAAMVLNVLLRFAWLQTVLNFKVSSLHSEALIAIVASLEIIRRGMWNFFRLENEHLNNVGKFRAFNSVPLPFNYETEEEEKDD